MEFQIVLYIIAAIYGLIIGSFVNVCADRLPEKEDIVVLSSHCPECGRHLRPWELVPLFSWLFLRGKCYTCKAPISLQYPLVELGNAVLWCLCAWRFSGTGDFTSKELFAIIVACIAMSVLFVIAFVDGRTGEIPAGCNALILACGVANIVISTDGWQSRLIGLFAISVPLFIIFLLTKGNAIGGGDIKFLAAAGVLLGWELVLVAFVLACVLGSVVHSARMLFGHASRVIRLGPYLAVGAAIAILLPPAAELLEWFV